MARADETPSSAILFVDDDPAIRSVCARCLREAGCQVQIASDGRETQAIFRDNPASIGLLVTDIEMPFLSGIDLADSAAASGSPCPVLLMSGHPLPLEVARKGWEFLAKPFSLAVLTRRVQQLLSLAAVPRPVCGRKASE